MHVLWDFDGTLATCDSIWPGVFNDLTSASGREGERAWQLWESSFPWFRDAVPHRALMDGLPYYAYLARTLQDAVDAVGISRTVTASAMRGAVVARLQYVLVSGAREALDETADRGHVNHLASNHVPDLPQVLARLGIGDCFRSLFISGLVGREKPSPGFWRHVEGAIAADPSQLVMVGDDWRRDIEPSLARGYHAVWVGPHRASGIDRGFATDRVDTLAAVPAVLDRFLFGDYHA